MGKIELRPLWHFNFTFVIYDDFWLIGLGFGPFIKAAQYQMDDGVKQGAMEVMTNIQGTMEVMTYI